MGIGPLVVIYMFFLCVVVISICLLYLVFRALIKYLKSGEVRKEKKVVSKTIGETLKEHRTGCKMTQEFVAEAIGVSRQAVSKWENGTSDPSTANLFALSKLFGISAEELINEISKSSAI